MATRTEVEARIAAINDSGNNTAKEVRDVLISLLDYTENTGTGAQLPLFDLWDENPLDDPKGGRLWYSFRGIEKTTVNFTFRLLIRESSVTNFQFQLDPKIIEALTPLFQQYDNTVMSFAVPVTDIEKKTWRVWTLFFRIVENTLRISLKPNPFTTNDRIQAGDEVFTSIQFHCPPFNFDEKK
ncbi:hypothetical protein [Chryseobacterium populi]|uniref:Uncharacterized protein n=1 Tax=Chryseobacterium populi TaxID=1144316 RepID=J2TCB4_9FLAO|nr:hypothetical protein [Chryseobacterium populi]EJL75842.1 hypothetical protein PMI13_00238 [Chryseobacterium populi]